MVDPIASPRERLTRAAVLVFSASVAALLVVQAGVPGCGANSPTTSSTSPEPAVPSGPVEPSAAPTNPDPKPPADPTAPPAKHPTDADKPSKIQEPPAKAAATAPSADAGKPPPFLPASKSGIVMLPKQQAAP